MLREYAQHDDITIINGMEKSYAGGFPPPLSVGAGPSVLPGGVWASCCCWSCSINKTIVFISRTESGFPHSNTRSMCQLQRSKPQPSKWQTVSRSTSVHATNRQLINACPLRYTVSF